MGKALKDLWIISDSGDVLFKRISKTMVDETLFGKLIKTFSSFSMEHIHTEAKNFQIGDNRYYIVKKEKCYFVAIPMPKTKEKKITKSLQLIAQKFLGYYQLEIEQSNGTSEGFQKFNKETEDALNSDLNSFLNLL